MRMGFGPLLGLVVALGLLAGIAFGGGVVYGRSSTGTPTPTAAAAGGGAGAGGGAAGGGAAAGGAAGGGAGGAQGGGGIFAGQTIGVIDSVQGDAVSLRAQDGTTTQFATTGSTAVTNSVPGSVADLRQGGFVAISPGPPDARGRTTIRTALVLPSQLAGGGAGPGGSPRPSATPPR